MRTGWLPMTLGTLGYFVMYFVLFWLCLHICGLVTGVGTLLAAFALGRLLTSVAVTPGGLGVVEAGSVALLVAMGADPAQAASGILLFTIFTHVLEIPFGVVAWLVVAVGPRPETADHGRRSRRRITRSTMPRSRRRRPAATALPAAERLIASMPGVTRCRTRCRTGAPARACRPAGTTPGRTPSRTTAAESG